MSLMIRELEHELTKYVAIYRSSRQHHAAFAAYAELPELVGMLRSRSCGPARRALIAELVETHRASPHPLWQALLLLAFAPMLKNLRLRVRSEAREDLDERILLAFLEAVARVGTQSADRVAMRLRQATERSLFRALRMEAMNLRLEAEAAEMTCGRPFDEPGQDDVSDMLAQNQRVSRALLGTVGQHGLLRAYARACTPDASRAELARVYRRLQQRRRRLLAHLRMKSAA